MHDTTLDDTITNRLSDDIFSVLFRVQVQFDAYVAQRDAGVRKRETADARFDHILPEACDKGVGSICLEAGRMCREGGLELRKRPRADRYVKLGCEDYNVKLVARLLRCQNIHVMPLQAQGAGTGCARGCHP